jgi:hypothetical protein
VGHPFLLPGETRLVLFAHTRYRQARSDGTRGKFRREDVRGLTLEIALATGACVRVAPDDVRLLEGEAVVPEIGTELRKRLGAAWEGWSRGKLRRHCLREGDQVAAVGELGATGERGGHGQPEPRHAHDPVDGSGVAGRRVDSQARGGMSKHEPSGRDGGRGS